MLIYVVLTFILVSKCQEVGTNTAENHPPLSMEICNKAGCTAQSKSVVLDSNWRWLHKTGGYQNCYTGNTWDPICSDPVKCAEECALDGADYSGTYGVTTSGDSLRLNFVTHGQYGVNIGSRLYLLDSENKYFMFKLKNKEFTFDVDVSNLPCGLNGALYFVEMDEDGGTKKYPTNKAGAKYGTGYCDAQCPHDLKFINGEANTKDWKPNPNDTNSGTGMYGTCCVEMDIWESNKVSHAVTPHPCSTNGQTRCSGVQCGDDSSGQRYKGLCDKDGCDFNPFRMGAKSFFGPGSNFTVDSTKPFTVITQFITTDNTEKGALKEIKRLYKQNGKVHSLPNVKVGSKTFNSITDDFCSEQKDLFGDQNSFKAHGGLQAMGDAIDRGVVLVMSLWDDHYVNMLWLDSNFPVNSPPTKPGVARGTCSTTSGSPQDVEKNYPNSFVVYSKIRLGDIGTTF